MKKIISWRENIDIAKQLHSNNTRDTKYRRNHTKIVPTATTALQVSNYLTGDYHQWNTVYRHLQSPHITTNQFKILWNLSSAYNFTKEALENTPYLDTSLHTEINTELSDTSSNFKHIISTIIDVKNNKLNCFTHTSTSTLSPYKELEPKDVYVKELELEEILAINETFSQTRTNIKQLINKRDFPILFELIHYQTEGNRSEGANFFINKIKFIQG